MKKMIIRSGMAPYDNFDAPYIINNNSIGCNVGNLVYQYGVFRTLMTDGVSITPDYYDFGPERADEINEKFDCYIIPLADAFREPFIPSLNKYTKLIKKLKIPVIVIGVGLRAPYEPDLETGFPFDNDVKEFIAAVLEKSNIIGVRGEITSQYLSNLGFKEGRDHMVIGCPSMYSFGRQLKIRSTNISSESLVCINSSAIAPENVIEFIARSMKDFETHYFIPQWLSEMKLTYTGTHSLNENVKNYPTNTSHYLYKENKVRFFLNVPTWIEFMKIADLSFGSRIHGNIVSTLAGTPSVVVAKDARMRELVEYHQLTSISPYDISSDDSILSIIDELDFQRPEKKHPENFREFLSFLEQNNLDHIYKNEEEPLTTNLDRKILEKELRPPLTSINSCSIEELVERWDSFFPFAEQKQKDRINEYRGVIKRMKRKLKFE